MANELHQLVDTANAPIFGIDIHGNVNERNNNTTEIIGYSKDEVFGFPLVSTFILPKLLQSVQDVRPLIMIPNTIFLGLLVLHKM